MRAMLARRSLFGLTLAALGALPAAGAARAEAPSLSPDMKRIFDRGRLVVAVAGFETPPFVVTGADGQPAGSEHLQRPGVHREGPRQAGLALAAFQHGDRHASGG